MCIYKRTILLSAAALISLLNSSTISAFQKTNSGKAQLKTELAEIDLIASEILKDRKAVLSYRPDWDQCKALVKTRTDAISLYETTNSVYRGIVRDGGLKFPKDLKGFEVEQNELRKFAGDKADKFNDLQVFEFAYAKNDRKIFISCFMKVNEKWAYFPLPWKGLNIPETERPGVHLSWIRMLHNEKYEDAYQFAAPILRTAYSFEKFKSYMKSLGLKNLADVKFTMRAGERRNSETALIRKGTLKFADGSNASVTLIAVFIKDEGAMPFQISIERVYGAAESAAFVPPKSECEEFSRLFVSEIVKSIEQDAFTEFHKELASYNLQQKADPEKFKSVFSNFAGTDFSFLENSTFSIADHPRFRETYGGCVEFNGTFRDPKTKNVLGFFISATESFQKWKCNSISLYPVRKYDPDAKVPRLSSEDVSKIASGTTDRFVEGISSGSFETLFKSMASEIRLEGTEGMFKTAFAFLLPLFEDEKKLGDAQKLKMKLGKTSLDLDHLKISTSLENPNNGNSIQGEFEYWYQDGEWKLIKINYKY